jgi:hypothetical protein
MKTSPPTQYFVTGLLIFLVLVALIAGAFYTFTVGWPKPTPVPTVTVRPHPTSTAFASRNPTITPELPPAPVPQYPEQAHITDGIIVMGIIIVAIILFGIAWGGRMKRRR